MWTESVCRIFFLGFTVIFYAAFNFECTFLSYYLDAMGLGSTRVGMIFFFRAMMEVPFLLGINYLRSRFKVQYLIMIAALLMSVECFLFGFGLHNMVLVCITAGIFGSGNGIYIGTSSYYIYGLAPLELKATAQAIYASVVSAASIIGNLLGGILFDSMGAQNFYITAAVIFVVSALISWGSSFLGNQSK